MAAPVYDAVRLDPEVSRGGTSSSEKPTRFLVMPSGREQRIKTWVESRKRWQIQFDQRTLTMTDTLRAFWEARDGGLRAFRHKDWSEFSVTNQALAPTGAGTVQLVRTYVSGGVTRTKNIYAPVTPITIRKNSVTLTGWTCDYTTGLVSLPVVLTHAITAISKATSAVVTVGASHGFAVNDELLFSDVGGMVEINGLVGTVSATAATTVTVNIDSSSFTTFTAGGNATKYLASTDTLDWSGEFDYPARFDSLTQEIGLEDAFIRSWSASLVEVLGSGGATVQPSIDPVTLPGLVVALYGSSPTGAHGASIATAPDSSGLGNNFTQGTASQQPTRLTTSSLSPTGEALMRFDGADVNGDNLQRTWGAGLYPPNTSGWSIYIWANWLSVVAAGGAMIAYSDDTNQRPQLITNEAGAGVQGGWRDQVGTTQGGTYVTGTHVKSWHFRGAPSANGGAYYYQAGVLQAAATNWNWTTGTPVQSIVGLGPTGAAQHMDMGAFLLFNVGHDDATRRGVEKYLTTRYG